MFDQDKNDSALTATFSRQLEQLEERTYDYKYANLMARMFCPTLPLEEWATEVVYRQWERVGKAKFVGHNATDIPVVDALANEFPRPVRDMADQYIFTRREMMSSARLGRELEPRRALACREGLEVVIDETCCFGAPEVGIASGMLNDPNVNAASVGGGNDWATLLPTDPRAIVQQISTRIQDIQTRTKGRAGRGLTLLLPDAQYALIATNPFGDNSDKTILDFMLANMRFLDAVEPWWRLETAGAGSVSRGVLYTRSEETLSQRVMDMRTLPPQAEGLMVRTICVAATAGMAIHYPEEMEYIDGI